MCSSRTKCSGKLIYSILTLTIPGGGDAIIILCRKIAISPEPKLRWISDQSVNSSLSVAVQEKTNKIFLCVFMHKNESKTSTRYLYTTLPLFPLSMLAPAKAMKIRVQAQHHPQQFNHRGVFTVEKLKLYQY